MANFKNVVQYAVNEVEDKLKVKIKINYGLLDGVVYFTVTFPDNTERRILINNDMAKDNPSFMAAMLSNDILALWNSFIIK